MLVLAQEEAHVFKHDRLGTEHLLLGVIQEGEGESIASRVLASLGVSLEAARKEVQAKVAPPRTTSIGAAPLSFPAKQALESASREALNLGYNYIAPEHVLLGIVHDREDLAAQILRSLGAESVREELLRLIAKGFRHR